MLRETQMAGARINHLTLPSATFGGGIFLDIPLRKAAQGGQQELTRRSLRCVYAAAIHLLYPACAARHHLATVVPGAARGTSGIPGGAIADEEGEQLGGGRPSGRTGGRGRRARVVMNFWAKVLRPSGTRRGESGAPRVGGEVWLALRGAPVVGLVGAGARRGVVRLWPSRVRPGPLQKPRRAHVGAGTGRYEEKTVDGVKRVFPVDVPVSGHHATPGVVTGRRCASSTPVRA